MMARILTREVAILAGGQGTRLGRVDKSQLRIGEHTVLERQLAALRPYAERIFVVLAHDDARSQVANLEVVHDRLPGLGPLGGLEAALRHATGDHVLVLGCDLPFINEEVVRALFAAPPAAALVCRSSRDMQP